MTIEDLIGACPHCLTPLSEFEDHNCAVLVMELHTEITRLQGQVAEQDADLESACKLVIAASLSTGHAQTMTELVSEVLRDVAEMRDTISNQASLLKMQAAGEDKEYLRQRIAELEGLLTKDG